MGAALQLILQPLRPQALPHASRQAQINAIGQMNAELHLLYTYSTLTLLRLCSAVETMRAPTTHACMQAYMHIPPYGAEATGRCDTVR